MKIHIIIKRYRAGDARKFAERYQMPMVYVTDLVAYRKALEQGQIEPIEGSNGVVLDEEEDGEKVRLIGDIEIESSEGKE